MTHTDHVALIQPAITNTGGIWADFGSGWGAFTLALRELAGNEVKIFSVDLSQNSLTEQQTNFQRVFPETDIQVIEADFTKPLSLPALEGILMANSLHFVENQSKFLSSIKGYLKPEGKVVIVEYDSDKGNKWVPYPLKFNKLEQLCEQAGFSEIIQVNKTSSNWLNGMYCAVAT
jgi:ubiquinone/menaquinone biosynthesis C-methylase UbiE